MFFEAMQKVAAVQILQDPDAKKLRMEARKAAKEARLVERRKEKEEHQKCKAIERYERDRSSRELVLKWSFRFSNNSCWKYSPFPYWLIFFGTASFWGTTDGCSAGFRCQWTKHCDLEYIAVIIQLISSSQAT